MIYDLIPINNVNEISLVDEASTVIVLLHTSLSMHTDISLWSYVLQNRGKIRPKKQKGATANIC
jgi:hypothetical protein